MRLGELTLAQGAIPEVDTFSWTAAGAPIHMHAWATDALFAALVRLGGLGLLELGGVVLVAFLLRAAYALARALGAAPLAAAVAVWACATLSHAHLHLRPHLFTLLGLTLLLLAYVRWREEPARRALLLAPLGVALWSNLHGGFLLGVAFLFGVAALEALEAWWPARAGGARHEPAWARARTLALLGLLAALAACLHPRGPAQYADALINTPAGEALNLKIEEWLPAPPGGAPGLIPAVVAAVGLALLLPARPPLFEAAGLMAAAGLALTAWRHAPLFGVVALPILAGWTTRVALRLGAPAPPAPGLARRLLTKLDRVCGAADRGPGGWLTLALAGAVALALGVARPRDPLTNPALAARYPVVAARWAKEHAPPGRLFNPYPWGGFLGWALGPERPVYIDSRFAPFRELMEDEYFTLYHARPGWRARLAEREITWTVLQPWAALAAVLELDPEWERVYADEVAVIHARRRR